MTTHEREITEAVDLCTPDGTRLAADARGWSRRPLHRANLDGCFGRNKRWDYWAVLAGDFVCSLVYSNVDHFGLADVWANLRTGERGGKLVGSRSAQDYELPERPGTAPLRIVTDDFDLALTDDAIGTHLRANWIEPDGRVGSLDVGVALPPGHESLNVVIPWNDEEFNFTSKHQARPATGKLRVGSIEHHIGPDAWGVLDVGRGRWPSEIDWNWGGGAGHVRDRVVGLQFGAKWTAGTGFTENGVLLDGRLTKIGRELLWTYEWDTPLAPWRVVDPGGQLDVTLTPRLDKHTDQRGRKRGSEVHQVFGTWAGHIVTDDGTRVEFDALQGFAEEARQRW
jgi:Protein of unknown function (DUF2804)